MCIRNVPGISIHFLSYLSRSILSVFFLPYVVFWFIWSWLFGALLLDVIFWPVSVNLPYLVIISPQYWCQIRYRLKCSLGWHYIQIWSSCPFVQNMFHFDWLLQVEGMQVHANEGGVTQTRGGIYWIILPAGCKSPALLIPPFHMISHNDNKKTKLLLYYSTSYFCVLSDSLVLWDLNCWIYQTI